MPGSLWPKTAGVATPGNVVKQFTRWSTLVSRAGWARGQGYAAHYSMESRYLLSNRSVRYLADNSSGSVQSLNYPLWAPANTAFTTELR